MTWPRGFAILAGVLASVMLSAAAAAPQDLATAEQEAFAALARAVASLERAADRSASIRAAEQLATAVDRARDAFAAADAARRAAADGYGGAYRAALAAAVTCANGYPCTGGRLDPFEGIAGALVTHLHLLASVSFAAAVHVEAVGVAGADEARARSVRIRRLAARLRDVEAGEALDRWNGLVGGLLDDTEATSALQSESTEAHAAARRSRFDAANRMLAAIAVSRGRASDVALGAPLDAAQTRAEALRSSLTEAGRAGSRAAVVPGGAAVEPVAGVEPGVRAPAPARAARPARPAAAEPNPSLPRRLARRPWRRWTGPSGPRPRSFPPRHGRSGRLLPNPSLPGPPRRLRNRSPPLRLTPGPPPSEALPASLPSPRRSTWWPGSGRSTPPCVVRRWLPARPRPPRRLPAAGSRARRRASTRAITCRVRRNGSPN